MSDINLEKLSTSPWWCFQPGQRIYCYERELHGRIVGQGFEMGVYWDTHQYTAGFAELSYVVPDLDDNTTLLTLADCARAIVGVPLDVRSNDNGYYCANHKLSDTYWTSPAHLYASVVINTPVPDLDKIFDGAPDFPED